MTPQNERAILSILNIAQIKTERREGSKNFINKVFYWAGEGIS